MVKRYRLYDLMIDTARKCFPRIPRDAVTLQTNQLDVCEGHYADITTETWEDVIDSITLIEVIRAEIPSPDPLPLSAQAISLPGDGLAPEVNGHDSSSEDDEVTIRLKLVDRAARHLGKSSTTLDVIWDGSRMDHNRSIESYDIEDGDSIVLLVRQSRVELLRHLSHGNLIENISGLDVSYLFWEAKTKSDAFPRPPASKPQPVDVFSPMFSDLGDTNSIVIPVDKVPAHLDKSLLILGLHTEARTFFITYWLPSILRQSTLRSDSAPNRRVNAPLLYPFLRNLTL
ncbi:uncharacterized protein EDB91DRAFT_1307537 [Suillus paluster]|uniref:uncharacterized protein n=1 Tax=Suillus paluster TaxID=48578 RepID=UPI001B872C31|nr:uncharacterized protein EDB91DRAFT_1307537 [Suillus paluster]KAG1730665.1 hypothetical protein EDB91DRAFT_1307537 [Suillus paluster]